MAWTAPMASMRMTSMRGDPEKRLPRMGLMRILPIPKPKSDPGAVHNRFHCTSLFYGNANEKTARVSKL